MKFSGVRLLVKDFKKCFKFYAETLGFEPTYGDENDVYACFKVLEGFDGEGLAIFSSDLMALAVGNADKTQPIGYREKSEISFAVENVDEAYQTLLEKGVEFINKPTDMSDWGMRFVCFYDLEGNLIELSGPLSTE